MKLESRASYLVKLGSVNNDQTQINFQAEFGVLNRKKHSLKT